MATLRPSPVRVFFPLLGLCGVLFAILPVSAQNRTVVMRAPVQVHQAMRAVPARPQSARIVSAAPVMRPFNGTVGRSQNRTVTRTFPPARSNGNRAFRNPQISCINGTTAQQVLSPVPPYGFNYEYLNAINKDLNIKAAIDPATQLALSEAARLGCSGFGGGGYIIWDGGAYAPFEQVEEQPQEAARTPQPQVIVVQVPAATQPAAQARPSPSARPEEEEQAPPLPDVGQFTLIMRDGTQLKAAAFTRSNDQIVYITPDGMRHTLAVSDLDTGATLRVNSEQGLQLQLSL